MRWEIGQQGFRRNPKVWFSVCDLCGSTHSAPDDQNGDVELVTNRVDSVAENKVFDAAVPVRAHDQKIGKNLVSVFDDFFARIRAVADRRLHLDLHFRQGIHEAVKIVAAGLHLSRRGLRTVDLTSDTFLHVQQIYTSMCAGSERRGMAQRDTVEW